MYINIVYYPHSEISSLGTLNAMFIALLHTQLTGYSTVTNKVLGKRSIYRSGLAFLTMSKKSQLYWSLGATLLQSVHKQCDNNPYNKGTSGLAPDVPQGL